jgi:hypothetical protein
MLANLALASFIKFHDSTPTAICVTVIMGVACVYFALSHFRWLRYVSGSAADVQGRNLKVTCSRASCTHAALHLLNCWLFSLHLRPASAITPLLRQLLEESSTRQIDEMLRAEIWQEIWQDVMQSNPGRRN